MSLLNFCARCVKPLSPMALRHRQPTSRHVAPLWSEQDFKVGRRMTTDICYRVRHAGKERTKDQAETWPRSGGKLEQTPHPARSIIGFGASRQTTPPLPYPFFNSSGVSRLLVMTMDARPCGGRTINSEKHSVPRLRASALRINLSVCLQDPTLVISLRGRRDRDMTPAPLLLAPDLLFIYGIYLWR